MSREKIKKIIIEFLGTIVVSSFLLPNQLSSGGFSGVATITYYLLNIPMGLMIMILNVPLFILAGYKIGREFFIKSLIGTVSLSVFIDIFDRYPAVTTDRFLACIYGGAIIGIGTAIILRVGASTGGSYLAVIDIIIIALNVIFFKHIEIGLYSAIAIYLYGQMIDIIFEGVYYTKLMFIISDRNEEIAKEITTDVKRGVTGLYGKGMFKEKDKLVLICAASRGDISKIKDIAKKIDGKCFIIIANAREVLGKGFKEG